MLPKIGVERPLLESIRLIPDLLEWGGAADGELRIGVTNNV